MLIAALLSDHFRARLIDAARDIRGSVLPARDWQHLEQLLIEHPVSVIVADPLIENAIAINQLVRMLRRWSSTPIIAYSQLTRTSAQAFVLLSRQGLRDVVLSPYDDSRVRFSHALRRAAAHGVVLGLRNGLSKQLATLPVDIAHAVNELLERPYAFQSGYDLITASNAPSSTVHLHLQQAGLGPPRRLFLAARVAHAAAHLRNPGLRIQDVARRLGYSRAETLTRHTLLVLGSLPGQIRRRMVDEEITNDDLVARLLVWIQLSPCA